MPPKFGTSGLRGLVVDLTAELVASHVRAFVTKCPVGTGLFVARDLRPSSPDIAQMVIDAGQAAGCAVTDCGAVPTPALALAAMDAGAAAVMVTGSHIPADRNGLKFYTPDGEITKDHETAILGALDTPRPDLAGPDVVQNTTAGAVYVARYTAVFGAAALADMTIGVYSHSTVGRDLLMDILRQSGARVIELGRSDRFVPVDTEAVDTATRAQLMAWAKTHKTDAIVSMDGDGDRPLLTDAAGMVVPGDVLGQITGAYLGADIAVTPVSSNTGAQTVFARVVRTRIGSPYVIAGMDAAGGRVVGYEANGGFLLGFAAKRLAPLMTRDSVLPMLVPLVLARTQGVAAVVATQPARFTAADRLQDVPTKLSKALIARLGSNAAARRDFLAQLGGIFADIDTTDGLRITLTDGRIIHLRPSGNAPECRFYAEAATTQRAVATLAAGLDALRHSLGLK
jgi:phosphomannomutase